MKTLYAVTTQFMNGTVTLGIDTCAVLTEKTAEKIKEAIIKKNPQHKVIVNITEINLYENESEIPILKDYEEK
jgi:hypothetical protein